MKAAPNAKPPPPEDTFDVLDIRMGTTGEAGDCFQSFTDFCVELAQCEQELVGRHFAVYLLEHLLRPRTPNVYLAKLDLLNQLLAKCPAVQSAIRACADYMHKMYESVSFISPALLTPDQARLDLHRLSC